MEVKSMSIPVRFSQYRFGYEAVGNLEETEYKDYYSYTYVCTREAISRSHSHRIVRKYVLDMFWLNNIGKKHLMNLFKIYRARLKRLQELVTTMQMLKSPKIKAVCFLVMDSDFLCNVLSMF